MNPTNSPKTMKTISTIWMLGSLMPLAATAAQMSDHFNERPQIFGFSEILNADTSFASLEQGETPAMHGSTQGGTVWAEWIAPASGWMTIDTKGTAFKSAVLAIYTGESLGELKTVARARSSSSTSPTSASFPVTSGTAYQIVLDSAYFSSQGRGLGQVNIKLVQGAIPSTATGTDRFSERPQMGGNITFGVANNTAATLDPFQPRITGPSGRDVWWQWTAPATGRVTIDTLQSDFDTVLTVFSGSPQNDPPFNELEMVAQNDDILSSERSQVSFQTQVGRVYQIAVSSASTSSSRTGNVVLKTVLVANMLPPSIPGSDFFAKRPRFSGHAVGGVACNTHYSKEANESIPSGDGGRTVWWQWQAPESGRYDIDTHGSEADTVLRVYTGESLTELQQVAFNDNVLGAEWSKLELAATRGMIYQIRIDHSGPSTRNAGNIAFNLKPRPAPEIDIQQPVRSSLVTGISKRNFGTVKAGSFGATKVFTIRNTGTAPLNGIVVRMAGSGRDYVIHPITRTSVAPGGTLSVKITFKPSTIGIKKGWLQVFSNDSDENPFLIPLTGLGVSR
jgi:hypothetical protein